MADIFISYAKEDWHKAQLLAQAFADRGWTVFWDRTIPSGSDWRDVIDNALKEARCVVVLWSRSSICSSWVREEAEEARVRKIMIPVRVEDVTPPLGFRHIHVADLSVWSGNADAQSLQGVISDVAGHVGWPKQVSEEVNVHNDVPHLVGDKDDPDDANDKGVDTLSASEESKPYVAHLYILVILAGGCGGILQMSIFWDIMEFSYDKGFKILLVVSAVIGAVSALVVDWQFKMHAAQEKLRYSLSFLSGLIAPLIVMVIGGVLLVAGLIYAAALEKGNKQN